MTNTEKIARKNKVAHDYIEKISNEDYFDSVKEIDKNLSLFKKDIEKTGLTHKTKEALQDFLVTENIFEWISDQIFKQNFSAIALLSSDKKEKINIAKEIINNSQKTEQEIREELGLVTKNDEQKETKPQKINTTEIVATNIETLKTDEKFIYNQALKYGVTDKNQIAYILATVKGESWFKNIKERWWENKSYGKNWYYGRGFVQLTHKGNYRKFNKIIKKSWIKFKDNKWIIMQDIDIVNNPDSILSSNELAAFILIHGMQKGLFRWKWSTRYSLDHFINSEKTDFYNARNIINWMSSKPLKYQSYAQWYLANLEKDQNIDTNESILIWPDLLAKNREEFGGLWNSIMTWFQWYSQHSAFKNMDGVEWKNTTNHPNRFKTKQDVEKYKLENSEVKSFVIYFWANTKNNTQTLKDIKQRSLWLKDSDIQPILSTCIGTDNNTHLSSLNLEIKKLRKELNVPVLDFESSYNKKLIAMWSNQHPTRSGYKIMEQEILNAAA